MACCDVDQILPAPLAAPLSPAPQAFDEVVREWCHEEELAALVKGGEVEVVDTNLGTSGVFFLLEHGAPAGVFKPASQEHVPEEFKGALVEGENLYRERAAYVVSQRLGGLCGVPATVIAKVRNEMLGGEQEGSLQRFVPNAVDMSDMGPAGIADDEVHKVGMLDILLLNLDRHEGNMLLKEEEDGSRVLIPIDHGLCLPRLVTPTQAPNTELLHQLSFVWQGWKHACQPFSAGARALAASLSPRMASSLAETVQADMPTLPRHALTTLKIGALTLRVCVGAGMALREVAEFVLGGLGDALSTAWGQDRTAEDFAAWESAFIARLEAEVRRAVGATEEEVAEEELACFPIVASPAASVATRAVSWTMRDLVETWGSSASSLIAPTAGPLAPQAREYGSMSPVRASAPLRRHHTAGRTLPRAPSCDEGAASKTARSKHHNAHARRASRRALRRGCRSTGGCSSVSSCSSCPSAGPSPTAAAMLRVGSSGGVCRLGGLPAAGPSPMAAMRRTAEYVGGALLSGGAPFDALQNVWRIAGGGGRGKHHHPPASLALAQEI